MKYLLHIDTSGEVGTVSINADSKIIASLIHAEKRDHAATINVMIEQVLTDAGIKLKELSGVVVCAGPGSYTGLRIGLSTAKGICYALDIPLFMHNKLLILAYQNRSQSADSNKKIVSILKAREGEYFLAITQPNGEVIFEPQLVLENNLDKIISPEEHYKIVASEMPQYFSHVEIRNMEIINNTNIDQDSWAIYASESFFSNQSVNLSTAEPDYLKQVYTHK